jgi:exonuclease III
MFQWRIDHILFRGAMSARSAWTVGASDAERTPSGLLPSDHAGVVATVGIGR